MKKFVLVTLSLSLIMACGKGNRVLFCEGVSSGGDGERCGTKFETGDLTALIESEAPFEAESIDVAVYQVNGPLEEKVDTVTAKTMPDEKKKAVTLSFYQPGKFRVKAEKGKDVIAQGDLEIVE
ncbi:MAG TPA: hypothetical protein PK341_19330 [Spirochaetota bacterium]|nr:hypothetical protein [Spirochaetota bacterium]